MDVSPTGMVYSAAPPHAKIRLNQELDPQALLDRCRHMHSADKAAERRKKTFGGVAIASFVFAFLTFFAGGLSETPPLFAVAGGLVVLGVVMLIMRAIFGAADVDDRKLDVVRRLVQTLQPELKKGKPVKVSLDFGGYDKCPPMEDSTKWYSATGVKVWEKEWLNMTFTLLDGSQLAVHAKTGCKRKQKAKRKYTKKKDRVIDELEVSVKPPRDKPLDPATTQQVQQMVGTMGDLRLASVKVRPRVAQFSFRSKPGYRQYLRSGWNQSNLDNLLDGEKALMAVVASYKAMTRAVVR